MVLIGALALVALAGAPSDVISMGSHAVDHTLVLETAPEVEGRRLVAAPVRGFGGVERIEQGVPFRFSSKYGTRFYAVPSGEEIPPFSAPIDRDDPTDGAAEWAAFPTWRVPVGEISQVPDSNPLTRVETRISWSGPEGEVEVVGETRWDAGGAVLAESAPGGAAGVPSGVIAIALVGLAGLCVVAVSLRR